MQLPITIHGSAQNYDSFSETCRSLFGNIQQRFFRSTRAPFCDLSYTSLGACRLSKISASSHGVIGKRVTARDSDEDSIKVLVQVEGRSNFRQGNESFRLKTHCAVIYDPSAPYQVVNATDVNQVILQIPRSGLTDRALKRLTNPLILPGGSDRQTATLAAFIQTSAASAAIMSSEMKATLGISLTCFAEGLICESFGSAMVETLECGSLLLLRERIKDYVFRHLAEHELSLEHLAQAMGCSVRYLHRAFEGETVTLQRFIWQARLDHSRRLLVSDTHRKRTIAEIAFQCGFSSSSHFSRQFRERFEMTPREMRFAVSA